jgi:hypothetical protein
VSARRAVALALLASLAAAGCLSGPGPVEAGCCGEPEGLDPGGPVAVLEFKPDLARLKRDFCSNRTMELPAPRFGLLRLAGSEDRLYEGPMPCTVILDPSSTAEQRNETRVFVDILEASSSGVAFTVEGYATAMLSNATVYGFVSFTAPSGTWGAKGPYEVGYDPREEGGRIVATVARLDRAPG